MKKKIFATALCYILVAMTAEAQLLYKISGKDLTQPSYIIGTHHLANVSFVEQIAGVKDALTVTEQVYGEVAWDDMNRPDSVAFLKKAQSLPNGKTLQSVLNDSQYKKLDTFLKKYMGIGLGSAEVKTKMGSLTPAALNTQLQLLLYLQNHMGDYDPSSSFDQYFQAQAKKNKEPIGGLETVAFQSNLLYNSTSMERQIEQLMCLIDNEEFNIGVMDKITEAFYAQDLDALKQAVDMKIGSSCDSTPEEVASLIDNRNADWAAKMPKIMSEKPTFFAVGAAHLAGSRGVLQLLKDAGYTVEAVK